MIIKAWLVTFSVITIMIFISCTISSFERRDDSKERSVSNEDNRIAIMDLSIAFTHAIGVAIEMGSDGWEIIVLSEAGKGGTSGLVSGQILKKINGIKIEDFGMTESERLIKSFPDNELVFTVSDETDSEKEVIVLFDKKSCPQSKGSDFVFITTPYKSIKPVVFHLQIDSEIEKLTFNHHAINWLRYYDSLKEKWLINEPDYHEFEQMYDLDNLSRVVSREYSVRWRFDDDSGLIGYSGENLIDLQFDDLRKINHSGKTIMIGKGLLKDGPVTVDGNVFIKYESEYYLHPYYEEKDRSNEFGLDHDSRHIEENVKDWLILIDESKGFLELSFDGKTGMWYGHYSPGQVLGKRGVDGCFGFTDSKKLYSFNRGIFNWYDGFVSGYESKGYPETIRIDLGLEDSGMNSLNLTTHDPVFLDDGNRVFSVLTGSIDCGESGGGNVSGMLLRIF